MLICETVCSRYAAQSLAKPVWCLYILPPAVPSRVTHNSGMNFQIRRVLPTFCSVPVVDRPKSPRFAVSFINSRVKRGCGVRRITVGLACKTFAIAARRRSCSSGIRRARTLSADCRYYPHFWATGISARHSGTCQGRPSSWSRRLDDWSVAGRYNHEPDAHPAGLAGELLHAAFDGSTTSQPTYDCLLSGHVPFTVELCTTTVRQVALQLEPYGSGCAF